ncbi:MAG: hypothetical protein IJL21_03620 [Alphaproteobacteria bacterium]|nr:hypothetical protein [Alphaproteobacteria bacterium]
MKNVIKFLCNFALCFVVLDAWGVTIQDGVLSVQAGETYDIDSESFLSIFNFGTVTGNMTVSGGAQVIIQNYGTMSLLCNNSSSCVGVNQIITGNGDMNLIAGLSGHRVIVDNENNNINLSDVIAAAGNAGQIVLTSANVVLDIGAIGTHPAIEFNPGAGGDSTNSVGFIIRGWNENWDESQPILNGIVLVGANDNFGGARFEGVDPMFAPYADLDGTRLYAHFARETNYGRVFENDLGDWLDELRGENPDDKLLGALDAARTRSELNGVLSRSMRTNPIRLLDPVRSFNTFMLGDHIHDLAFGVVAEPFYVYSGDFSVMGGGAGVAGRITKNLVAKFGGYAGRMDYDGEIDNFNAMIYGANFGALYKDSDFYARAVGTLSSAQFKDIEIFDGVRGKQNPNGISGAGVADGGIVFRVLDEFDLTPFIGARFDYAGVAGFSDTDVNMRFGVNIDKETIVDGNKYAFGISAVGQTNGDIYGSIYTDIMSVVDGVGGRLQFGILNDDLGLSYRISLDAKFAF